VGGGWRRLHNEELHNLCASTDNIGMINLRRMRWTGRVARIEEMRNAHKVFVVKPEGEKPLARPWEDNIIIDLIEVG